MKKILTKAYDPEIFRSEGHKLVDTLTEHLHACQRDPEMPVLGWIDPEQHLRIWADIFAGPADFAAVHEEFLDYSIHLHHPKFIGHQVVPPVPVAALSDLVAALTNNAMAIYEMGPAATAIETLVIEWLLPYLGWTNSAGGVFTSGGSLGNLTALLAARQQARDLDVWENGVEHGMAVMLSADSHYSVERAIRIMGLGSDAIVKLPVDGMRRIDTSQLESAWAQCEREGKRVFALVGNACSTSMGTYDPLPELAEFCQSKDIWFHVDAAHGGAAALSAKYRYLLQGIEGADSVVLDFHKMMLAPALTTAVIFRDGEDSRNTFSQSAAYLLDEKETVKRHDVAARTIECTKKAMALKVYQMIKLFGAELFEAYVDQTYDLARTFADVVDRSADFELAIVPDANIVCFRFVNGQAGEALNALNLKLRDILLKDGEYYCVQTVIGHDVFLRLTIMNPFTTIDVLCGLLEKIRKLDGPVTG